MTKYNTKEFKQLQEEWYKKLENEGFVDIERTTSIRGLRKEQYDGRAKYGWASREWNQSKLEYYYLAEHFLNNYNFKKNLDRIIWEYHVNGISVRDIADLLQKSKIADLNYVNVWHKINKLRKIMRKLA